MYSEDNMRLIDPKHPDRLKRPLNPQEAAAIRRFCGAGQNLLPGDVDLVKVVLEEMHDGRSVQHWLECDCVTGAAKQPKLSARVRNDGPRHFFRMNWHGDHHCALATFRAAPEPDDDDADDDSAPPGRHNPLKPVGDALDYLDDVHEDVDRPGGDNGGSPGGSDQKRHRLPRLGRIMHTLLEDAGFATTDVSLLKNAGKPWDRLTEYAENEAMSQNLSLGQVLYTKPWVKLDQKMAEIDALPWPAKKSRSALLLFVADEIRDGAAIKMTSMGEAPVRPEKGIRIGGRDQGLGQPPYWVLAVVDRDRAGKARFREAFAQHAYKSFQPVPLDSRYEAVTLDLLIKAMRWVEKEGVDVTLDKPLFDRSVRESNGDLLWCRPDFELTFRTKVVSPGREPRLHRIVIETMGAEEPEYLERKSRTHEIMKRRGIMIEHRFSDEGGAAGQAERDTKFMHRVGAKILDLAGVPRKTGS
jgi:hypothetical protein